MHLTTKCANMCKKSNTSYFLKIFLLLKFDYLVIFLLLYEYKSTIDGILYSTNGICYYLYLMYENSINYPKKYNNFMNKLYKCTFHIMNNVHILSSKFNGTICITE